MEEIVFKLGAVVMFIGGIILGRSWCSKSEEQQSCGISTTLAGAIVMAVSGAIPMLSA